MKLIKYVKTTLYLSALFIMIVLSTSSLVYFKHTINKDSFFEIATFASIVLGGHIAVTAASLFLILSAIWVWSKEDNE